MCRPLCIAQQRLFLNERFRLPWRSAPRWAVARELGLSACWIRNLQYICCVIQDEFKLITNLTETKMKKFFAFAFVALAATLASCGGNSEANATDSTAMDSIATEVVAAVDSAKAMVDSTAVAAVDSAKAAVEAVVK